MPMLGPPALGRTPSCLQVGCRSGRHIGFTNGYHGYHSCRANHGNGACCHGNSSCCHGNIGSSSPDDQDSISSHVTHLIALYDLLWLVQNPYISIILPSLFNIRVMRSFTIWLAEKRIIPMRRTKIDHSNH